MSKRILVTGSEGYLGPHIVRLLKRRNCEVVGVDAGWFTCPIQKKGRRLVSSLTCEEVAKCDSVVHLGWFSSAGEKFAELQKYSLQQTEHLVKLCEETGTYLVFASTASVYGFQQGDMLTEEAKPNPVCAYGKTKLAAEKLIRRMLKPDSYVFLRKGTLMGPGAVVGTRHRTRLDLVVNAFVASAVTEGVIRVWDPETCRPQLHVEDAAAAYVKLATTGHLGHSIINLAHKNYMILPLAFWVSKCLVECNIPEPKIEVSFEAGDGVARSYRVSNELAIKLGFTSDRGITEAVAGLVCPPPIQFDGLVQKNVAWMEHFSQMQDWTKTIRLPEIW